MRVLYFSSILRDGQNGGNVGLERNLDMVRYTFGQNNVYVCELYFPSKFQGLRNCIFHNSLPTLFQYKYICRFKKS